MCAFHDRTGSWAKASSSRFLSIRHWKKRSGELPNFTGVGSDYEAPNEPEVHLRAGVQSIESCVQKILDYLD